MRAEAARESKALDINEDQEEVATGRFQSSIFKRYFGAAGWGASLAYPLALTLQTGLANGQLLWLQAWAKRVSEDSLRGSLGLHMGVLALLIVARFFTYGGSLLMYLYLFTPRISLKLHYDEINGLLRSGANFFLQINPGRMINRFTQDIYSLDYQICAFLVNVYFFIIELGFSLVLDGASGTVPARCDRGDGCHVLWHLQAVHPFVPPVASVGDGIQEPAA